MTDVRNRSLRITGPKKTFDAAQVDTLSDSLANLVRTFYTDHFGPIAPGREWDLNLAVHLDPADNWNLQFDPPLAEQLLPQMEALQAETNAYQAGRVYCFRCEQTACDHAAPTSSLEVFYSYDQLGCPQWAELTQVLIEAGDERVEWLFGHDTRVVTGRVRGADLRARQLTSFGKASKTFSVLGQVIVGYFRWQGRGIGAETHQLALSYQAVEVRDARGRPSLKFNRIFSLPTDDEFSDLAATHFPWVLLAERQARKDLKVVEEKLIAMGRKRSRLLERVPDILAKLESDLARGQRQERRQTQHARDRRQIQRPVDKAMADLRRARPEQMYLDLRTRAIVLCGGKGRCHVFNEDGRHVTSFVINANAIELRVRKKRWASLALDRVEQFLQQFGQ